MLNAFEKPRCGDASACVECVGVWEMDRGGVQYMSGETDRGALVVRWQRRTDGRDFAWGDDADCYVSRVIRD